MTKETLKHSIMTKVEDGALKQRARSFFVVREYGLWLLAIAVIAIGAFAMALIFAAADDLRSTVFVLRSNGLQGMLLLPYVWIVTLVAFLSLGLYRLRQTEHGYKYPLWGLLGIVFAASVGGGGVLYATGLAHSTDHFLAERSSHYQKFGNPQHAAWRTPEGGRLAGKVLAISTSSISVLDIRGTEWKVLGTDVTSSVKIGMMIRMVGEQASDAVFVAETFAAKRVPAFAEKKQPRPAPMPRQLLKSERK
jgi:hypothetical protein